MDAGFCGCALKDSLIARRWVMFYVTLHVEKTYPFGESINPRNQKLHPYSCDLMPVLLALLMLRIRTSNIPQLPAQPRV
jgi:hypothetical protein